MHRPFNQIIYPNRKKQILQLTPHTYRSKTRQMTNPCVPLREFVFSGTFEATFYFENNIKIQKVAATNQALHDNECKRSPFPGHAPFENVSVKYARKRESSKLSKRTQRELASERWSRTGRGLSRTENEINKKRATMGVSQRYIPPRTRCLKTLPASPTAICTRAAAAISSSCSTHLSSSSS